MISGIRPAPAGIGWIGGFVKSEPAVTAVTRSRRIRVRILHGSDPRERFAEEYGPESGVGRRRGSGGGRQLSARWKSAQIARRTGRARKSAQPRPRVAVLSFPLFRPCKV